MELFETQKEMIEKAVNDLFYTLKIKLLGRFFKGPRIYFELLGDVNPLNTIEGIYKYTMTMNSGPGFVPNEKRIKHLSDIAGNFVDAQRLKTLNHVMAAVEQGDSLKEVRENVQTQLDKATSYIDMLVNTEVRTAQAYAEREGIERVGAAVGVDDPVVFKSGVVDGKLCHVCKDLWHSESNVKIPKVYKLSELKDGYSTHKDPIPTVGGSHPRCRHVLTFLPPNFAFDASGRITFKSFGHDEYASQRGTR